MSSSPLFLSQTLLFHKLGEDDPLGSWLLGELGVNGNDGERVT